LGGWWSIKQKLIMKKIKVVLVALAGLAGGAIAGILFAPKKGTATRQQIAGKADGYMDELKIKYFRLRNSLIKKLEITKKDAEKLAGKGKANYDAKKDVENKAASFKHPSG
jgi:gas vesicle protein